EARGGNVVDSDDGGGVVAREVALDRPRVYRIVVAFEQVRGQRVEGAAWRGVAPLLDRLLAVELHEAVQARREQRGRAEEVRIFRHQQLDAQRLRRLHADAGRGAHRREQRLGDLQVADLAALGLDVDRTRRVQRFERSEELALEALLRRLRIA